MFYKITKDELCLHPKENASIGYVTPIDEQAAGWDVGMVWYSKPYYDTWTRSNRENILGGRLNGINFRRFMDDYGICTLGEFLSFWLTEPDKEFMKQMRCYVCRAGIDIIGSIAKAFQQKKLLKPFTRTYIVRVPDIKFSSKFDITKIGVEYFQTAIEKYADRILAEAIAKETEREIKELEASIENMNKAVSDLKNQKSTIENL